MAETGRATAARGLIVALAIALPLIRIAIGPHRLAILTIGSGGLILASSAIVFDHLSRRTTITEATCGLLLLIAAGTAALGLPPRD